MLAFIIFANNRIRSTIKEGKFACSQCQYFTHYTHKKATKLIPLGSQGAYVECEQCKNTFIERVLELSQMKAEQLRVQNQEQPVIEGSRRPAVEQSNVAEEKAVVGEFLSEKQKAIKKLLILDDGKVEDAEISAFHKVYKSTNDLVVNNVYDEIEQVKSENKSARQYLKEVAHLLNDEGKREIIQSGMMIAAADGNVDTTELNMLATFGKALGLNNSQVKEIIGA